MKGYNSIVGVKDPRAGGSYVLIAQYRHADKPDETFYLAREQVRQHSRPKSGWGNLRLPKDDRKRYAPQSLTALATALTMGAV